MNSVDEESTNLRALAFPETPDEEDKLRLVRQLAAGSSLQLTQEPSSVLGILEDASLLAYLRFAKNDPHAAIEMLKKTREYRETKITNLTLPTEYAAILDTKFFHPLNFPTKDGQFVILWKVGVLELGTKYTFQDMLSAISYAFAIIVVRQVAQKKGVVLIVDFDGFGKPHLAAMTVGFIQLLLSSQGTLPLRMKGIHIFNTGYGFKILYKIMKPLMKTKMQQRLMVHETNSTTLRGLVNPEVLPTQYGGDCDKDPYEDGFLKAVYDSAEFYCSGGGSESDR